METNLRFKVPTKNVVQICWCKHTSRILYIAVMNDPSQSIQPNYTSTQISKPSTALSCWDEVKSSKFRCRAWRIRMPRRQQFVTANPTAWSKNLEHRAPWRRFRVLTMNQRLFRVGKSVTRRNERREECAAQSRRRSVQCTQIHKVRNVRSDGCFCDFRNPDVQSTVSWLRNVHSFK